MAQGIAGGGAGREVGRVWGGFWEFFEIWIARGWCVCGIGLH